MKVNKQLHQTICIRREHSLYPPCHETPGRSSERRIFQGLVWHAARVAGLPHRGPNPCNANRETEGPLVISVQQELSCSIHPPKTSHTRDTQQLGHLAASNEKRVTFFQRQLYDHHYVTSHVFALTKHHRRIETRTFFQSRPQYTARHVGQ